MNWWNLLFPKDIKCIVCDSELNKTTLFCICKDCLKTLPFIPSTACIKCGTPMKNNDQHCTICKRDSFSFLAHRSVIEYDGSIVNIVRSFKYFNAKYLATYLGNLLVAKYINENWAVDIVVPVPLHPIRQKERGFNQAELLANQFKNVALNVNATSLMRIKHLPQQAKLSRNERLVNLKNSFMVDNSEQIKDKTILLIDDIFTTGQTMEACTKALLNAGAKNVYALSICRPILETL